MEAVASLPSPGCVSAEHPARNEAAARSHSPVQREMVKPLVRKGPPLLPQSASRARAFPGAPNIILRSSPWSVFQAVAPARVSPHEDDTGASIDAVVGLARIDP